MPNVFTSRSAEFQRWYERYEQTGELGSVRLGMTRDDLRVWFGEPDATGPGFRRRPFMGIWRYGIVEFHFSTNGTLFLVYSEQPDLIPRVILSESPNESPKHPNA